MHTVRVCSRLCAADTATIGLVQCLGFSGYREGQLALMCGGGVGLDDCAEATQLALFLMPASLSLLLFPPRFLRLRVFKALIKNKLNKSGNKNITPKSQCPSMFPRSSHWIFFFGFFSRIFFLGGGKSPWDQALLSRGPTVM